MAMGGTTDPSYLIAIGAPTSSLGLPSVDQIAIVHTTGHSPKMFNYPPHYNDVAYLVSKECRGMAKQT